jgi:hypothetical protein
MSRAIPLLPPFPFMVWTGPALPFLPFTVVGSIAWTAHVHVVLPPA